MSVFASVDCPEHAGHQNSVNRATLDSLMNELPNNQSGNGRHKCAYCAYNRGYSDGAREGYRRALDDIQTSLDKLVTRDIASSQG